MKSKTWLILASASLVALALAANSCAKDTAKKETNEAKANDKGKLQLDTSKLPKASSNKAGASRISAAPIKPLQAGAKKADNSYNIKLDAPKKAAQGSETVVRVTVTPNEGWKMNEEFPTRLKVTPPEGVSVAKDSQVLADAEKFADKELTFAIKFTPSSAGEKSFAADFRFAVCTDATCDPKREKLAWVVAVE